MIKQFLLAGALASVSAPHPYKQAQTDTYAYTASVNEIKANQYEMAQKWANVGGITIYYYAKDKLASNASYPNTEQGVSVWERWELFIFKINESQTVPNYDFEIRTNYKALFTPDSDYNLDYYTLVEYGQSTITNNINNFPDLTNTQKSIQIENIVDQINKNQNKWNGVANDVETLELNYNWEQDYNLGQTGNIAIGSYTRIGYTDPNVDIFDDLYYGNETIVKDYPIELIISANVFTPTTEVVDIGGLMFQILGMPFAFISQAFNLTLFPGTPYSINVSNLLFAVITGLLIIIILRKLLK